MLLLFLACAAPPQDLPVTWLRGLAQAGAEERLGLSPGRPTGAALDALHGQGGAIALLDQDGREVTLSLTPPPALPGGPELRVDAHGISLHPGYDALPPDRPARLACRLEPCAPAPGHGELNAWVDSAALDGALRALRWPTGAPRAVAVRASADAPWGLTALAAAHAGQVGQISLSDLAGGTQDPAVDLPPLAGMSGSCALTALLKTRSEIPARELGARWTERLEPVTDARGATAGLGSQSALDGWQPFPAGGNLGLLTCLSPGHPLSAPAERDTQRLVLSGEAGWWELVVSQGPRGWWTEPQLALSDQDSDTRYEAVLSGLRGGEPSRLVVLPGASETLSLRPDEVVTVRDGVWTVDPGGDVRRYRVTDAGFSPVP
ncbi:MAG: hypothetical protein JXX28_00010 [Deltaproteobacteria bacterium]|nr:hypothetical protein [Deltaproteobacteria bacterium]